MPPSQRGAPLINGHTRPHAPQWSALLAVSTQSSPQRVSPAGQIDASTTDASGDDASGIEASGAALSTTDASETLASSLDTSLTLASAVAGGRKKRGSSARPQPALDDAAHTIKIPDQRSRDNDPSTRLVCR